MHDDSDDSKKIQMLEMVDKGARAPDRRRHDDHCVPS